MKTTCIKSKCDWDAYIGENQEVEIEGTVRYCVTPGDPGCRMTRNGDGWPPSPPEIEFFDYAITKIILLDKYTISLEELTPQQREVFVEDVFAKYVDQEVLTNKILESFPSDERDCE